jgi:hypothetical protein
VGDAVTGSSGHSHEIDNENACADISSCSSGGSENWVVLSISGDKPIPRFNVYINPTVMAVSWLRVYKFSTVVM